MPTSPESILDVDFRWPNSGDQALGSAPNSSAEIAKNPYARMVFMADGYKEASDILVETATTDRFLGKRLVYPILFGYRHFLELSLKHIISEYGHLAGELTNTKDHDLELLWSTVQKIVTIYEDGDLKAMKVIKTIVAEFATLDPQSFTFRYPLNRNGVLIEINIDNIDLPKLRDTMAAVANYFVGVDGYLVSLGNKDN